jgi:A/G-specific adenine glycosylase
MPTAIEVPARVRAQFFERVVAWQQAHGRRGLPWQQTQDPYRVWLSEVMLQQTQVSTVLRYYTRFLQRFPDLESLAAASLDEVLALWSGLGYYSRARHLHACARLVVQQYGGRFPASAEALACLPGIGASTAAAIAAFCHGERRAILDGNVRRVLARVLALGADLRAVPTQRALWQVAQNLIPPTATPAAMRHYTQGMMDLGATVCTRSRPACTRCPVRDLCAAQASGDPTAWPVRGPRAGRRSEHWVLPLFVRGDGRWWLQRRPTPGIWAGLWAPPVWAEDAAGHAWLAAQPAQRIKAWPKLTHALTHRDLVLLPLTVQWALPQEAPTAPGVQADQGDWWSPADALALGLPAPVRAWLKSLCVAPAASSSR